MSIKSTHYIDRKLATQIILNKILSSTNDELAEMLESFEESKFRNYIVLDELPEEDNEENRDRTIRNINEF